MKRNTRPRPQSVRFWEKVDRSGDPGGCWLWTAALNNMGYGAISAGGKSGRRLLAHRVSYELHKGPIPAGAIVLHACDTPRCVNPEHLSLGTQTDSMSDCARKGRHHKIGATHCPKGHEYTPGNVYRKADGSRFCRTCHIARVNAYRQRRVSQEVENRSER